MVVKEIDITDERFILQIHIREAATLLTMLSSNLADENYNIDKTKQSTMMIIESLVNKINNYENINSISSKRLV